MKLSTKIAYNTIIQFISKFLSTIIGLVIIAIITRYLGKFGFGEYTAAITFLSIFGIIADLGLTLVTVQLISQPGADKDKILGNLLALRLVSAVLLLGLAPLVALFFPYSSTVKMAIFVASFSFLFIALNQIMVGLFQKELRMDKVSIAEVANRIMLLVGVIIIVKTNTGLIGIMFATVLSSLLSFFLHYIFSLPFARIRLRFDWSYWKEIMHLSWPLALTIALNLIYLKTDTLLLSVIERPSEIGIIAEVGIYGAAYKVIDVLVTIPFMFAGIILPLLTAKWAENDQENFKQILQKSFNVMIILAIPMIVGTQIFAEDIMTLVAGQEFSASGPILKYLIFAAGAIFFGNMFAHAVIAINKQKKIIGAYLFTAITSLTAYVILIPKFSYFAAAWITIYSEVFIALASFYIVWKFTKFIPNFLVMLKSLLASTAMLGLIYILEYQGIFNLIYLISSAFVSYFVFLFLFRGISKEDILSLINK
ncbi:hypothetical protein C0583_06510 [Candidatus Parcubacteria bacterium]|nr:MAG: hypothetical protein C0583_06510 [Candidatus Parcubacteria bacterium]